MIIPCKPAIAILLIQLSISACSFNYTRYTDGPLTQYVEEPLPELDRPLARSLNVEKVQYNTAGNMKGIMIGDLVAREIYILPKEVGHEVDALLRMENEYSGEATLAALNTLAKRRTEARHMWSGNTAQTPSRDGLSSTTEGYIEDMEDRAREAYDKGDYLRGDIYTGAAMNAITIDSGFAGAQATADFGFSVINAGQKAGEAFIKNDFNKLRDWIEKDSGVISPAAAEGTNLSVFVLRYLDAKSFQFDGRVRLAVYLVLTDEFGVSTSVLEGSDILFCKDECNLFKPKPTAKIFEKATQSGDIQNLFWTPEGTKDANAKGFDHIDIYQYVLILHGLKKLIAATDKKT